jgi:drug/metabolite transporter (DMT)-like permease
MAPVSHGRLVAAFAAVYLIWGTGYLAIQVAMETLPPFTSAGMRFFVAGMIMIAWLRLRGQPLPPRVHWRTGILSSAIMFLGSGGSIVWGAQYLPSGIVALLNATLPLWMVLLEWLVYHHARPDLPTATGLIFGMSGMALLAGPDAAIPGGGFYIPALVVVLLAPLWWAFGSLLTRRRLAGLSPLTTIAMQLPIGGLLLLLFGMLNGEWAALDLGAVSLRSWLALLFLIFGSSIAAFGSFSWLMRVDDPARVTTYAFVNPVIALILGVLLVQEPFTARTAAAAALVLSGVVLIIYRKRLRLPGRVYPVASGISR